jgi:uncharacterized membrane protein YccC
MLAVSCGLWIADHLPYTAHGYWIVLTIVVILKPNYSMTKHRRSDRLVGTMIGCILTAIILNFIHEPLALLALLFIVTAAAPAFIYIKYRYTAIAASMQILLQINLMIPSSHAVIGERLIDTVLGAAIATAFSYVLPSWEYRALPRLLTAVLQASQKYILASRDMLEGKVNDDFYYRVGRKGFMDSLSLLVSALVRMMDEPPSKQHAVREINRFVVQNYLVAAHVAAMRVLLRRHADGLPREEVNDVLEHACVDTIAALTSAQRVINPAVPEKRPAETPEKERELPALNPPGPEVTGWSGWYTLQRRAALLDNDAREIVIETDNIKRVLRDA